MALAASKNLAEIRLDVATKLGLRKQVETSTAMHATIDSHIRTAFQLLIREAEWSVLDVIVDEPLIAEQNAYPVPDNMEPGDIHRITVTDLEGYEYPLRRGVEYYERNIRALGGRSDRPIAWDISDGAIVVYPAPAAEVYTGLRIQGRALPVEPNNPHDPVVVDATAITMQAVILYKTDRRKPTQADVSLLARHLQNIRGSQAQDEEVQIGPARSRRYPSAMSRRDDPAQSFYSRHGTTADGERIFYPNA